MSKRQQLSVRASATRATYAQLVDHFHLTPAEIGELTDRQIAQLYFHPRDKDGAIRRPESEAVMGSMELPTTMEQELADIDLMCRKFHITPDRREVARNKVKEKWQKRERTN